MSVESDLLAEHRAYTEYQFLYPPRPETVIDRLLLTMFEKRGCVLQFKKNGTNNVIAHHQGEIIARQRENIPHVRWSPSPHTAAPFRKLPGWTVVIAELIHSKVKGIRDINYIHEILVYDSQQLTDTTFTERQDLLARLFKAHKLPIAASGSHYIIDEHTWLARNHTSNFAKIFANLSAPEDEGIVLKAAEARLKPCLTPTANVDWLFKLRLPRKSYER